MSDIESKSDAPTTIVWVRRQWNDYREAAYDLTAVHGLHWSGTSGGVYAPTPQPFVHGYVMCNEMIEGELAHSGRHGPCPHSIKVCLVKSSNKKIWPMIEAIVGPKLMRFWR